MTLERPEPADFPEIDAPEPLNPGSYKTLIRLVKDEGNRFVISLGGGSVPAICGNVALVQLVENLGLREHVEAVWGTSAGAVIGGGWSSGTPAEKLLKMVQGLSRRTALDVPWVKLLAGLLKVPFGAALPDGLINVAPLAQAIGSSLSVDTFESCPTPFRCIACSDDGNFRTKVFERGPLLQAMLYSMSLPGIFFPRPTRDGDEGGYYDGGLVEKTPLLSPIAEHGRLGGDRRLLLLATHYRNEARNTRVQGSVNRLLHSLFALEDLAWTYQVAEARQRKQVRLMLLNPKIPGTSMFDFEGTTRNYGHALAAFTDTLRDAKLALTFGME